MKIKIATLFLFAFWGSLSGQKASTMQEYGSAYNSTYAQLHYWNYQLADALDTVAIKAIIARERFLQEDDALRVTAIKKSHTATHITFAQFYKGVAVFGGGAKVAISKNNTLFRCIETLFSTQGVLPNVPQAFNVPAKLAQLGIANITLLQSKGVYLWNGDALESGWYTEFLVGENGYAEAAWTANGALLFLNDKNRYLNGPDSLVTVQVFAPDPITPISKTYGGTYIDANDGNTAVLDPLRMQASIPVHFANGTFSLLSDYVEITEHSAPVYPVVTATSPDFSYSRTDYGFEQVNAYYHIMTYQAYLQALGYTLVNFAIQVDAQGFGGSDNSAYTGGTVPPRLTFGEGGVDDAEDADVVIHEYGHAISDDASPNTNTGLERRTLDEAFGDYVAVSYTRSQYSFGSNLVFNWDGHNPFWPGRTVDNPNNFNYKTISSFNDIYRYATLWNAAMFDIWNQLGKTYTDSLQIEALYGYFQNMGFAQAALLVIDADTLFSGGAHGQIIWKAFDDRGILDWSAITEKHEHTPKPYRLLNTVTAHSPLYIDWLASQQGELQVYDVAGRRCHTQSLIAGENSITINDLQAGMYTLHIIVNNERYVEKVVCTH